MNDWINFDALWKIVVIGVVAGAGLPALFAVGLKALAVGEREAGADSVAITRNPVAVVAAAVCFAVVLAAVGWGIYLIIDK